MNNLEKIKKAWIWIWKDDSFLSWIVALLVIFIFVKFIFFPGLALVFGTSLPLAGVESSSMDHQIIRNEFGAGELCGNNYEKDEIERLDFDGYWDECEDWYEERGITKLEFSNFPLKNGFSKGDIIIVWGRFTPKLGDVIIFRANPESRAPRPIIHRIVSMEDGIVGTKGDHNAEQLTQGNNIYRTDETGITNERIIGKAVLKIPYLGWPKIWLVEFIKFIFG
jgi:signal peptidase I